MKQNIIFLINSILAGIMIGIGGTIFLSLENRIIGSFMFAIGLFVIVSNGFNLFTGKVGYVFDNNYKYFIEVFITLVGNFIGTYIVGFVLKYTRISEIVMKNAQIICEIKIEDNIFSILILSIFCGLLMYIAVNGYKTIKSDFGKILIIFLAVSTFILCGFEHCIANMFYFAISEMWSLKTVGYLIIMILGNSIGGVLIPLCNKLIKKIC